MSVALTSKELDRLGTALRILASPHQYERLEDWRGAVRRALASLLRKAPPSSSADDHCHARARRRAVLRLVKPLYRAGARAHSMARSHAVTWADVIERLGAGAATFDGAGTVLARNAALLRLLAEEPERARMSREIAAVARLVGALAERSVSAIPARAVDGEVRTADNRYVIRGVAHGLAGSAATVFVERIAMSRAGSGPHASSELTPRERQVAALFASGGSTSNVASTLGISVHTARRHAEHLLTKLGVHSRGEAVAKLRGD
jgi:DNA-binding CsgD family transcriptional regulator